MQTQPSPQHFTDLLDFIVNSFRDDIYSSTIDTSLVTDMYNSLVDQLECLALSVSGVSRDLTHRAVGRVDFLYSDFLKTLQPDGVGRSPGQPLGAVDQVTTPHHSKCTCDDCSFMGFGFGSGPEFYPFVVGE
ncbi:MAG: hypothetical protein PHY54_17040 [Methylococcales bacterium]|nr:hypothetical protein [Methylococcales bacterium]